jgi:DNA-binding CsgD family transcriptional regulator
MGSPRSEAQALTGLAAVARFADGPGDARDWARQAREPLEEDLPGYIGRWLRLVLAFVLSKTSDLDSARRLCADGLVRSREIADLVWRETTRQAESDLTPLQLQAAWQRGANLSLTVAAEPVMVLTSTGPTETRPPSGIGELTVRERELVVLVARGRTNAHIAAQLFISVRTVGSHLDRIRDKTGCRRRADLTRLALRGSLI